MTSEPVRDFDYHPDEDHVRVFTAEPGGVLRFGGTSTSARRPCPVAEVPLLGRESRAAWLRRAEISPRRSPS